MARAQGLAESVSFCLMAGVSSLVPAGRGEFSTATGVGEGVGEDGRGVSFCLMAGVSGLVSAGRGWFWTETGVGEVGRGVSFCLIVSRVVGAGTSGSG